MSNPPSMCLTYFSQSMLGRVNVKLQHHCGVVRSQAILQHQLVSTWLSLWDQLYTCERFNICNTNQLKNEQNKKPVKIAATIITL